MDRDGIVVGLWQAPDERELSAIKAASGFDHSFARITSRIRRHFSTLLRITISAPLRRTVLRQCTIEML